MLAATFAGALGCEWNSGELCYEWLGLLADGDVGGPGASRVLGRRRRLGICSW